jgi:hypothetical protein
MASDYLQDYASQDFYKSPTALGRISGFSSTPSSGRLSKSGFTGDVDVDIQQNILSEYEKDVQDFGVLEAELAGARTDTVDESIEAARRQNEASLARSQREASRYGLNLTPAEQVERQRLAQMQGEANVAGAANLARRSDEQLNLSRLAAVTGIGQLLRGNVLGGLSQFAQATISKKGAYENARASSKANQYGFLGSIGSALTKLI